MLFGKRDRVVNRILIVEDEPLTAFDNETMIADAGYEVVATLDRYSDAVATLDKPFLFSNICGVLSSFGMNIIRGHALTNPNGLVLDVFQFTDDERFMELNRDGQERVLQVLEEVVSGKADVAARLRETTQDRGVDRVVEVDLAGNVALDLEVVRAGGEIVVYGSHAPQITLPFFPAIVKNVALIFFIVYNLDALSRQRAIDGLASVLTGGKLVHNVAARLPLARIAEAHELVESGAIVGNVVVDVAAH